MIEKSHDRLYSILYVFYLREATTLHLHAVERFWGNEELG